MNRIAVAKELVKLAISLSYDPATLITTHRMIIARLERSVREVKDGFVSAQSQLEGLR